MKLLDLITSACLTTAIAIAPGCKKQEDNAPSATPATGSAASSASRPASAPAGDPNAHVDHITVLAGHKNPKPNDPVRLELERFKVVKADFDPLKIEGGTATIELDLTSLRTGSDERDDHLKSPAYLDVAKLATASITIDNVKHKAGPTYTASATVAAHGITKTYPVTFDVLERKDDRIRIRGAHVFSRLDFAIGSDPAQDPDEQVASDVTIDMVLTIAKT